MIGCFDRPFLLAGAWVRLNGNRFYAMFFACVILLRLLHFLHTFLTQSIALRAFGWKLGISHWETTTATHIQWWIHHKQKVHFMLQGADCTRRSFSYAAFVTRNSLSADISLCSCETGFNRHLTFRLTECSFNISVVSYMAVYKCEDDVNDYYYYPCWLTEVSVGRTFGPVSSCDCLFVQSIIQKRMILKCSNLV